MEVLTWRALNSDCRILGEVKCCCFVKFPFEAIRTVIGFGQLTTAFGLRLHVTAFVGNSCFQLN